MRTKETIIAFGTITASFADAITGTLGDQIKVKNGTNADLVMKIRGKGDTDPVELTLLASDLSVNTFVIFHRENIEIKYKSAAPTSGSFLVQSIGSGL